MRLQVIDETRLVEALKSFASANSFDFRQGPYTIRNADGSGAEFRYWEVMKSIDSDKKWFSIWIDESTGNALFAVKVLTCGEPGLWEPDWQSIQEVITRTGAGVWKP
jgi:hypothetical protein